MTRRQPGHGTIYRLPSGRFHARVWLADGRRHDAGTHESYEEAEGVIAAMIQQSASEATAALTVRSLFAEFLDDLELSRSYVAMPNARSIGRRWLEQSELGAMRAHEVEPRDVVAWVRSLRPIGYRYARQALSLLRRSFAWGIERDLVSRNPATEVRVPRRPAPTEEPWTYLDPGEQRRLIDAADPDTDWGAAVKLAIGAGLRGGEQWCLRLADVVTDGPEPHIIIRYGSRMRAPKGRRIRVVPLFGMALEGALEQLERLRLTKPPNDHGLLFPGERGGFRKVSRIPGWREWLARAGITRRVRWHDLRHTCGASLVSGWWGRSWSLQEARDLLGHTSIRQTERYAHLGPSAVKLAAAATPGPGQRGGNGGAQACEPAQVVVLPRHSPQIGVSAEETGSRWLGWESTLRALADAAARGEDCGPLLAELREALDGPHAIDRALDLLAALRTPASQPGREVKRV